MGVTSMSDVPSPANPPHVNADAEPSPCALRVVPSDELLQGQSCVHIRHADALYTLRATRSGKLILTK